jgi:hydrogenase nickel incorporation protein HypB
MQRIAVEKKVLSANDVVAARLRERFAAAGTLALNVISSPGSGKTLLLERTLERFAAKGGVRVAVVTGDIQTDNDARRLARYGFPVRQITTAGACHLDAGMVERSLEGWDVAERDLLVIENVGNLVCPTSYDLGEDCKIVLLSVTEGEDKPLKYPGAFFRSSLMVLNKMDLLPYVSFNVEKAKEYARSIHPGMEIIEISCTNGAGLDSWVAWVERRLNPRLALY